MENNANICFLEQYDELGKALMDCLGLKRATLKKLLNKSQRSRFVPAKSSQYISLDILNSGRINPVYSGEDVPLLLETDRFLFVHKPRGVHNYPLRYLDTNNILSFLRSVGQQTCSQKFLDRGLLNRLDFETSGILVVTKTDEVKVDIIKRRENFFKNKIYICISEGEANFKEEKIEAQLSQVGPKGKKIEVREEGEILRVDVKVLATENNKTLFLVKLYEGRRHQIRVLLANRGFPLVGDPLYGKSDERMFLHHYYLNFFDGSKTLEIYDENISDFKSNFAAHSKIWSHLKSEASHL